MQLDFDIRLITPSDSIAELTELLHRAYRPLADAGMRFLATFQDEAKTRERIAKGECWLAVEKQRLIGTVTLYYPHEACCPWYARRDVAAFGQFAVEPECQSRGIGSRLLEHVERRAAERGAAELSCDTAESADHLIAYYTRRGYRFIEYAQWRGANYRSVVLSKSLISP